MNNLAGEEIKGPYSNFIALLGTVNRAMDALTSEDVASRSPAFLKVRREIAGMRAEYRGSPDCFIVDNLYREIEKWEDRNLRTKAVGAQR